LEHITVTPLRRHATTAAALQGTSAAAVEAELMKHPGANNPIVVLRGA